MSVGVVIQYLFAVIDTIKMMVLFFDMPSKCYFTRIGGILWKAAKPGDDIREIL